MPPDGLGGWPHPATPAPGQGAGWPRPVKGSLRRALPALDRTRSAGREKANQSSPGAGPLDLQLCEVLWADIALKDHPRFANSVAGNLAGVSLMLRALHEMVKPDLHTLLSLHARARGSLVTDPATAETHFGTARGCTLTPLDGEALRAHYLQ